MRHRIAVVLGLLCTGWALADEEDERFPVRDLVARESVPAKRETHAVSTHPLSADAGRHIAGESRLMASALEENAQAWFDGASLCAALDAALPPDAPRAQFDEKALAVVCAREQGDAIANALAELRAREPRPVALRVAIERWPDAPGTAGPETLLSSEGHALPCRTTVLADASEHAVVADYDVELAQAASIGDPVLSLLRTGASVALCVTPLPDGRAAVVEAVARTSRDLGEPSIDLGHPGFGAADRCAVAFDEMAACVRVENGRPSETTWIGRDGARMVLRVEATWKAPPPPGDPAVVVSPLFRSAFLGFRHVRGADTPHEETPESWDGLDERQASAEDLLADAFHDPAYAALCKGGGSVVVLPASGSRGAADRFHAFAVAADARMKAAHVECIAVNVPAGTPVSLDAPLPQGSRAVARFEGTVVLGLPVCATGGTERRYLADWDVEVAESSRIPDPLFMGLASGHFLDVTARERSVDVDLDLRRLDRLERQEMQLAVGRDSQGVVGEKEKKTRTDPALPPERVAVEKPDTAQLRISATIPLGADGSGVLRRSGGRLAGAGREIVVLVRVR